MNLKCASFSLALVLGLSLIGCAGHRSAGPYATPGESDRDSLKAQRLTQEAAALIPADLPKAERLLREALAADLYHGPAHNNLGVVYLKQGDLFRAAGEFEWAQRLMPGLPDPRMNLALVFERAGRTHDALAHYFTALEVYPNHLPTLEAITRLQLRSGTADNRTHQALQEIAMRGESQAWKDWARRQMLRADVHSEPR